MFFFDKVNVTGICPVEIVIKKTFNLFFSTAEMFFLLFSNEELLLALSQFEVDKQSTDSYSHQHTNCTSRLQCLLLFLIPYDNVVLCNIAKLVATAEICLARMQGQGRAWDAHKVWLLYLLPTSHTGRSVYPSLVAINSTLHMAIKRDSQLG